MMVRQGTRDSFRLSTVNHYLAHKQHLLPASRLSDVLQVSRDLVALHATSVTSPYLSLWSRSLGFRRELLDQSLYGRRELARALCMRVTLHVVPSDELPLFHQACRAYIERHTPRRYRGPGLLVQAGVCSEEESVATLDSIQRRVLDALTRRGPSTLTEISQTVPELQTRMRHDVGKPYEGEFSIGSRLVPEMCAQGLLSRARPRGTWRSNLYEYAPVSAWLPGTDLESVHPQDARTWLVRRYLSAFGPALFQDIQWWTGFTKTDASRALQKLETELLEVTIEGLGRGYLMLREDAGRLREFDGPDGTHAFFLPELDPYIMGYRERQRFLDEEHFAKIFDRAGNAMPTVWASGRIVGAWGQHSDGSVVYQIFEAVGEAAQASLAGEAHRLEGFLQGETLPQRSGTAFTRALQRGTPLPQAGSGGDCGI